MLNVEHTCCILAIKIAPSVKHPCTHVVLIWITVYVVTAVNGAASLGGHEKYDHDTERFPNINKNPQVLKTKPVSDVFPNGGSEQDDHGGHRMMLQELFKTEFVDQIKKDLKEELVKVVMREIYAEIKADIDKGQLNLDLFLGGSGQEAKQEIKSYLKQAIAAEVCQDTQNIHTDPERKTNDYVRKENNLMIQQTTNRQRISRSLVSPRLLQEANRIAFTASFNHDVDHMAIGQTVKFNSLMLNDGNAYNTHTGVFMAPVDGVYLFSFHYVTHSGKTELRLVVDDENKLGTVSSHLGDIHWSSIQAGNVGIFRINRGQSVWVETFHVDDGQVHGNPAFLDTVFTGCLLYAD